MTTQLQLMIIAVTGDCNLACKYCYADRQKTVPMSDATIAAILAIIKARYEKSVPLTIQFTGGEPLLAFHNIQQIVEQLKESHIHAKLQIQTNGTCITPSIAAYLKSNHIAVGISLDGMPTVNDFLRPLKDNNSLCSSTNQTILGLKNLAQQGIEVGVTAVITKENIAQLSNFIDFLFYLGNIRQVGFNLLRPQGRGIHCEQPSAEELQVGLSQAIERAKQLEQMSGLPLKISPLEKCQKYEAGYKPFSHCYALHSNSMYIDPIGDIYACASLSGKKEYKLGNVESYMSILYRDNPDINQISEKFKDVEEHIHSCISKVVDQCKNCEHIKLCGGGCYSRADETGTVSPLECVAKQVYIKYYKK